MVHGRCTRDRTGTHLGTQVEDGTWEDRAVARRQENEKPLQAEADITRGEKPEEIHRDKTFEQLKDSVYEFGVLVPIVVRPQTGEGRKPFVLVDGERRLRAALETGAKKVPAHITESGEESRDLIQAFHIHMLRKQWRAVARARALKRIVLELRRTHGHIDEDNLLEELQERTGCTDTQLKALRRATKYPDSVLEEVDENKLQWSHLIQIEESFVEQLGMHYPQLLKRLGKKKSRDVLIQKARRKILGTRSLIDNIRPVIAGARSKEEKEYASELFERFIEEEDMTAEEVLRKFDKRYPLAKEDVVKLAKRLADEVEDVVDMLEQMETSKILGFPSTARKLDKSLRNLRTSINKKLRALRSAVE